MRTSLKLFSSLPIGTEFVMSPEQSYTKTSSSDYVVYRKRSSRTADMIQGPSRNWFYFGQNERTYTN